MKNNYLKGGILALMMIAGTALQAQTSSTTDGSLIKGAGAGVSVKLIDNKGTIKYLQTNNGITSITSTSPGSATTTTWQLGGALVDNTYIDVSGKVFGLDKIDLVNTANSPASINAVDKSVHGGSGSGWTLLVRDESTGDIKKLQAADLIVSGSVDYPAVSADEGNGSKAITVTGIPTAATDRAKIWVYRNGAKLIYGQDFTVATDMVTVQEKLPTIAGSVATISIGTVTLTADYIVATAIIGTSIIGSIVDGTTSTKATVTVAGVPFTANANGLTTITVGDTISSIVDGVGTSTDGWQLYTDDVFEIQWIK
jgi:hypothetical protein